MKTLDLICLAAVLIPLETAAVRGEPVRTDVNPALLYYRAFLLAPDLSPADRHALFDVNRQGQKLPERFGALLARYNNEFRLLREAAHSSAPCDWGINLQAGPNTLLPYLARCKAVAVVDTLRVPWDLQHGLQSEAAEDLVASFALGRNATRDGTLISILVQQAIEMIGCETIAANFGQFSPETLSRLMDGLETSPARRTVAACIPTERGFFENWLVRKVEALRKLHPQDDSQVMAGLREIFPSFTGPRQIESNAWRQLSAAAGGTSAGLIRLMRDRDRVYARLAPILSLPYPEFRIRVEALRDEVRKSPNPFVVEAVPAFIAGREREFRTLAYLAMVRAAVEYKLHGEAAFRRVSDPCGQGPFAFRRFVFEGVDRGFELTSGYYLRRNKAVLIFVEKSGPPFQVDGNDAGRALPAAAAESVTR